MFQIVIIVLTFFPSLGSRVRAPFVALDINI
nr:MAG TPA: hypothetical protein [Caudoviricetes sp.]